MRFPPVRIVSWQVGTVIVRCSLLETLIANNRGKCADLSREITPNK